MPAAAKHCDCLSRKGGGGGGGGGDCLLLRFAKVDDGDDVAAALRAFVEWHLN